LSFADQPAAAAAVASSPAARLLSSDGTYKDKNYTTLFDQTSHYPGELYKHFHNTIVGIKMKHSWLHPFPGLSDPNHSIHTTSKVASIFYSCRLNGQLGGHI
jgi:hypothetical protein